MTPAWAGITLVMPALVGVLVWELSGNVSVNWPDASISPAPAPATSNPSVPPVARDERREDWTAALLTRPLFSPTRRAVVAIAQPLSSAALPPRLAGVMVSPVGRRAIFAATTADGKATVADEGDHLGPFIVLEIAVGGVTVIGPDGANDVVHLAADPAIRAATVAMLAASPPVPSPAPRPPMLDLLRSIPGETTRLGPPGGPVPPQTAR